MGGVPTNHGWSASVACRPLILTQAPCHPSRHVTAQTACMARRGDPDRIFEAQRAGVRARPIGTDRVQPETADRWLDVWAIEAATRDLPRDGAYRNAAYWIAAERAAQRHSRSGA